MEMKANIGVIIDFRLDDKLFNLRRLQVTTKVIPELILKVQHADDYPLLAHTPEAVQVTLIAVVNASAFPL